MKVLYMNKTFSGPMKPLAHFIAQDKETASVFMAERWPREEQVPGVMMMRIPDARPQGDRSRVPQGAQQAVEDMMTRYAGNALRVMTACQRLRKSGFVPDVIYASTQDGYTLHIRQAFPKARLVARVDWLYPCPEMTQEANPEALQRLAYERMYNVFQLPLVMDCAQGISSSEWQKQLLCKELATKFKVIGSGVDAHFFAPAPVPCAGETITFSCHGASAARGITTICQCLPKLFTLRPQCRVHIVSFSYRKNEHSREQRLNELAALLPPLREDQRSRISISISPDLALYLSILQQSKVYVYLTTPYMLSSGLLEAMSCGTCVLASATESVREIVRDGENGLLWNGDDAESLAFAVTEAVAKEQEQQHLGRKARETVLAGHDMRTVLPHHAAAVLGTAPLKGHD